MIYNNNWENKELIEFNNKLFYLNLILNSEFKYLFLTSLISSDLLIDKESYQEHIETCNFIKNNITLMKFDNVNDKEKILEYITNTLETLNIEYNEKYL